MYTHTLAASVTFELVRVSDLLPEPERQIESGMSLARTHLLSDSDRTVPGTIGVFKVAAAAAAD